MAEEHFEYISQEDSQYAEEPASENVQYVSQDDPEEVLFEDGQEEQEEVVEEKVAKEEPEDQSNDQPKEDADPLASDFMGDSGFDHNKFQEFVKSETPKFESPQLAQGVQDQKAEEEKDIYTQVYEKVNQRREEMRAAYLWRDHFTNAINNGYDTNQARNYADSQIQSEIDRHINEFKEKTEFDLKREREMTTTEKQRAMEQEQRINEMSRSNFQELSQKYGGPDIIGKAAFDPQLGWPVLQFLYASSGADTKNLTQQEYQDNVVKHANRLLADKNTAAQLLDIIHAKTTRRLMPQLVNASIKQRTKTQQAIKGAGVPNPRQAGARAAARPAQPSGGFGGYINKGLA